MQGRKSATTIVIASVLLCAACAKSPITISATAATTTNPTPPATAPETITSVSPPPSISTIVQSSTPATVTPSSTTELSIYEELATKGTTVYFNYCAPCHGSTGQGANGPALLKPAGILGQSGNAVFFANNAAAMLDFISYFMPLYAPGTFSHNDYVNVTCYLLVQAGDVQPMDMFIESQLKNIKLK